ncbi:MAG: hypothetical protein U9Q70_07185 [Chloroflexota bacterium]|nr:hypothetical protein [Chloroflexota bacterium]
MAKKRRTPKLSATQRYSPGKGRQQHTQKNRKQAQLATAKATAVTEEELAAEYKYVLKDLKHIGVIALAMLALLIALALILI